MAGHKVYASIVQAVRSGKLREPFTKEDFKKTCPGLGSGHSIEQLSIPGTITGSRDYVFEIVGRTPDTAHIIGNLDSRYFGVKTYDESGYLDLLLNTTDPFDGVVIVDSGSELFEVNVEGSWEIEITIK